VKPLAWTWNAGTRTVRGIHPRLARPDDAWADAHLVGPERALFHAMDPRERDHGVRVARTLLRRTPDVDAVVVRAALLHDVGKARRRYAVHERVLVHLLPGPVPPPEPLRVGVAGARQVAAHHPAYGAAMLRDAGAPARLADLVARHHAPGNDPQARALHDADRRT
jgi:putative nucleotidyltransferase with HDIG domain